MSVLKIIATSVKAGILGLAAIYLLDIVLPIPDLRIFPGLESTACLNHKKDESNDDKVLVPDPKPAQKPNLTFLQSLRMTLRAFTQRIGRVSNPTVPGPYALPFLGNLFFVMPFAKKRQIHVMRRYLREQCGIINRITGLSGIDVIMVADADAAKEVLLAGQEEFVRHGFLARFSFDIFKQGLFILPTGEGFGPTHLRHALEATNLTLDQLVQIWSSIYDGQEPSRPGSGPFVTDVFHVASCISLDVIGHVAFSYEFNSVLNHLDPTSLKQMKAYQRAFDAMAGRIGVAKGMWKASGVHPDQVKPDVDLMKKVIKETIAARRNSQRGVSGEGDRVDQLREGLKARDVLDRMLDAKDWTDEEIMDEVIALFLAGGETTANSIVFCIYLLDAHPEIREKMVAEIDSFLSQSDTIEYDTLQQLRYTEAVVRETMRVEPVVLATIGREVMNPAGTTILGHHIRRGSVVALDIRSIHRDPRYWRHPGRFMPSRWLDGDDGFVTPYPGSYMPFADGPHVCLGNKMAMLELKCAVARLYRRFDIRVVPNQDFTAVTSITHGFKNGLKVQVIKRDV
ncbi:hypothetical protein HDU97_003373 [Phlyctochytrium planicorne]|nr:hypothetical protein HDU97_003373 [Phlyctochytrium planicorne]